MLNKFTTYRYYTGVGKKNVSIHKQPKNKWHKVYLFSIFCVIVVFMKVFLIAVECRHIFKKNAKKRISIALPPLHTRIKA